MGLRSVRIVDPFFMGGVEGERYITYYFIRINH